MVQNKKIVDELKKYNTALEKHFTNLDFDSLSQLSEGTGNLSQNPALWIQKLKWHYLEKI